MGWAKHDDAIAYVKSEYDRTSSLMRRLAEAERGTEKIPTAIYEYLVACRLMGRREDHDLIEVCLDLFQQRIRSLSWRIR